MIYESATLTNCCPRIYIQHSNSKRIYAQYFLI